MLCAHRSKSLRAMRLNTYLVYTEPVTQVQSLDAHCGCSASCICCLVLQTRSNTDTNCRSPKEARCARNDTFADVLGERWTAPVDEAWRSAQREIAQLVAKLG